MIIRGIPRGPYGSVGPAGGSLFGGLRGRRGFTPWFVKVSDGPPALYQAYDPKGPIGEPIPLDLMVTADLISDATTVGKALVKAGSVDAAQSALGGSPVGKSVFVADSATAAGDAIGVAPRLPGSFPWPQGLVAMWDFQADKAGGNTVTSRVGSQNITLTARGTKTVVKDAADPGPFGPSLVLDGATAFVKDGDIGPLDISKFGDEVTVICWVKDTRNTHELGGQLAFRAGSHVEGSYPARQYGLYFNCPTYGGQARLSPHIGAQDGASPGYPWNHDYACSARHYFTTTGQGIWHMEAKTYDGEYIRAYVDGIQDSFTGYTEYYDGPTTAVMQTNLTKNPYRLAKGINRSQTTKRFSIGAALSGDGTDTPPAVNFTTGKLGGVAVFNRALTAKEIMQIRLATLPAGGPVTMLDCQTVQSGGSSAAEIGFTSWGPGKVDVSALSSGDSYRASRPGGSPKAFLRKANTGIGATWYPVGGLNSSQIRRLRFKMLSAATTSAAQRLLVKVGSQWWASNTAYSTTTAHADATAWGSAETKTLNVDWGPGNWLPVSVADTGGTLVYQNRAKNPALSANANYWSTSSAAAHASGGRYDTGSGFVWRITWSGTDAPSGCGAVLSHSSGAGIAAVTPGTLYSASAVATPSKAQTTQVQILWYNSSSVFLSSSDGAATAASANTATTLSVQGVAPAGAAYMSIKVSTTAAGSNWVNGDILDVSKVLVVAGTIVSYFDGSSANSAWDGTAGASTSTQTLASGVLSIGGSTNAAYIDNAAVTAVGFISSGGDGSDVRVTDLELLPT